MHGKLQNNKFSDFPGISLVPLTGHLPTLPVVSLSVSLSLSLSSRL